MYKFNIFFLDLSAGIFESIFKLFTFFFSVVYTEKGEIDSTIVPKKLTKFLTNYPKARFVTLIYFIFIMFYILTGLKFMIKNI